MAIVYNTVALRSSSITLQERTYLDVTLTNPPNGTVEGLVQFGDGCFKLERSGNDQTYRALVIGYRCHRQTTIPLLLLATDDDGAVEYMGGGVTLTVGDNGMAFARPVPLIRQWLMDDWDPAVGERPKTFKVRDIRTLPDAVLKEGVIAIDERKVETTERGRGDYKDNEYPVRIRVVVEGRTGGEAAWTKWVAEVKRIITSKWNYIDETNFDFITYDDDGWDRSDEGADRYDWEWNIRLNAPLRGRSTAPAVPYT